MEKIKIYKYIAALLLGLIAILFNVVGAADTVGGLATNIGKSVSSITTLMTQGAYLAGIGFAIVSILKFKQHKDNPTQIPLGTPISLLGVAAALIFLPSVIDTAGETVFGTTTGESVSGTTTIGK